jgi:hypothetical protein
VTGTYKVVFDACLPRATQVADKLYVIKLANERVDRTRRRVQNEVLGHRGRKGAPSTGPADCSRWPRSDWATRAGRWCKACSGPGTPEATWPLPGRPKKPSASSTAIRTRPSPSSGSTHWSTT